MVRKLGACAAGLILLAGCSSAPPEPLPPTSFSISSSEVEPWPLREDAVAVQCNDMVGGATVVVRGKTYGLTGRDGISWRIRGYEPIEDALNAPYSKELLAPLKDEVEARCVRMMAAYDAAWIKQNK